MEHLEKKHKFWEKELTEQDRSLREEYCELEHRRKELESACPGNANAQTGRSERKTQAILADHRQELEADMERTLAQRRAELDKLAETLQRTPTILRWNAQMEEKVLQVLVDKRTELVAGEEDLDQRRDLEERAGTNGAGQRRGPGRA